jgi:hypothetical protein
VSTNILRVAIKKFDSTIWPSYIEGVRQEEPMATKRTEVIKFCRFNGLKARGFRSGGVVVSYDTHRTNEADWVHFADNWEEAHAFLLAAVHSHNDTGASYPWHK